MKCPKDYDIIPYFSLHPDRINYCPKVVFDSPRHGRKTWNTVGLRDNSNHNKISKDAEKKIKRAVSYLSTVSDKKRVYVKEIGKSIDFKLTFVTLTLSSRQIHSDQIIRRDLIHHFITIATRKWAISHYVMRSERQANGNIHFHFVCNVFIPHAELREVWNNIQNKLGYVDRYREEMRSYHKNGFKVRKDIIKYWPLEAQKQAYMKGKLTDWAQPNSTDIHSLRLIKNVSDYICKYISKNSRINHEKINGFTINHTKAHFSNSVSVSVGAKQFLKENIKVGRLWSCSNSLSGLSGGVDVCNSKYDAEMHRLYADQKCRYFKKDYCEILFFDIETLHRLHCTQLLSLLNEFLTDRFNYHIQLQT